MTVTIIGLPISIPHFPARRLQELLAVEAANKEVAPTIPCLEATTRSRFLSLAHVAIS
ncbi:hypothetical protein LCGC14_2409340, partial [marine sediment metagenome]